MFKIKNLTLFSKEGNTYTYTFKEGINYFKGKNNSGKTEFYNFLDYMFGSSDDISKKPWFNDSLQQASIEVQVDNIIYRLTRTLNPKVNYLNYDYEQDIEAINLNEYVNRLNIIFMKNSDSLEDLRKFVDEELTYRTFTLFNFLGEKNQGIIHDFFDKCRDIKYSIKLTPLLNYIFNDNLEQIFKLQNKLEELQDKLENLEYSNIKYDYVCSKVNENLEKIGLTICYKGDNANKIRSELEKIKNMDEISNNINNDKNISDLEVMYCNISEQIKIFENRNHDIKQIERENNNRKLLLKSLDCLLKESKDLDYLIKPLENLLNSLDNTISFSNYTLRDNTVKELKNQKREIRNEIKRNENRFKCYSLDEKSKYIALIENYLNDNISDNRKQINKVKLEIKTIKKEIKQLQNQDDYKKINNLSDFITDLYKSAGSISSIVSDDISKDGFKIQYLKKGNILQPVMNEKRNISSNKINYYTGSLARHTLIQLCGYLGFLHMLINENKYPIIPFLVVDHISKPFDGTNAKAIGQIINKMYKFISKDDFQIFMFDDEDFETLSLNPDFNENLVTEKKSGFNPFYQNNL